MIVGLVNLIDKVCNDLTVKRIYVEGIDLIVEAVIFKAVNDLGTSGIFQVGRELLDAQILLLVLDALTVDDAAAKARGPAVFVVRPCVHAALSCLVDGCGNVLEPFLAHVLGLESAACVHEKAADAHIIHQSDLSARFLGAKTLVPRPERNGTVLFVHKSEIHFNLLYCRSQPTQI